MLSGMIGSSIIVITVASPPITPLSNVLITVTDERRFVGDDSENIIPPMVSPAPQ